jgi:hypothetical protein
VQDDVALIGRGGDVEEGDLVGALRVVAAGDLDGSPASRRSTKLVPLTTRPAVTSRQGMMRLASIQGGFQLVGEFLVAALKSREPSSDRRKWRDRRWCRPCLRLRRRTAPGYRRCSTGRRWRSPEWSGLRQLDRGFDVDAGEHAVAADVGVDDRLRRRNPRTSCRDRSHRAGQFRPAIDRHLAVLGIEPDDDLTGEGAAGVVQETGILDRGGADDDVADSRCRGSARWYRDRGCRRRAAPESRRRRSAISLIAASFFGLPAKAPFRSTRCRRRAPDPASAAPVRPG